MYKLYVSDKVDVALIRVIGEGKRDAFGIAGGVIGDSDPFEE